MTKQDYYEECVGITSNLCSLIAGMINQRPTLKLGRNLESFSIPDERAFTLSFTLSDQELKGKMGSAYPTNIIDDFVAVSVSYDDATKTYNVRQTFRFGKARQSPAGHKNDFTPLAVKTMTEFWATSMGYKITHRYDSDGIYRISVVEKEDSFVLSQNDDGRKNLILQMLDNIKANIFSYIEFGLLNGQELAQVKLKPTEDLENKVETAQQLLNKALEGIEQEDWAYKTAERYQSLTRRLTNKNIPFEKILELLKRYKTAKLSDKKISIYKIVQGLMKPITAYRILNRLSLKISSVNYSSYTNCTRKNKHIIISEEQKADIKRAVSLEMSAQDMIYFLDINISRLLLYQRLRRLTGDKRPLLNKPEGFYKRGRSLTYRIASQVYEAQDLEFNPDEISQLTGRSTRIVNCLIQRRSEIEPKIISALRVLYPNRNIDKPYITK